MRNGRRRKITVSPKTIITPLARDTARELGKEILRDRRRGSVSVYENRDGNYNV